MDSKNKFWRGVMVGVLGDSTGVSDHGRCFGGDLHVWTP